jgi:hypothetical protein
VGARVLRGGRTLAALLALALATGCVGTVVDRTFPGLAERRAPIRKIAVAPLKAGPEHARDGAALLSRQLAEALAARGVEVIAPEDVGRLDTVGAGVPQLAASVARKFAADAVLVGEVTRWVDREGERLGAKRPAAVGVHVVLHGAPNGEKLWQGTFDRTQQAAFENLLLTPRYPGRGTRWLSAPEFARFAAQELAAQIPATP